MPPLQAEHSRLYGSPKDTGHSLRQKAHNLTLPSDVGSTARQNFIMRMLFTDMYWWSFLPFKCYCVCFLYILCIFLFFLLCCNASAFVICAIKNYLLTYNLELVSNLHAVCRLQTDDECTQIFLNGSRLLVHDYPYTLSVLRWPCLHTVGYSVFVC